VIKPFIDSNVLIYLLSSDEKKAEQAEAILQKPAIISVQVLNEVTHVARYKAKLTWEAVESWMRLIQSLCCVENLTPESHHLGRRIAKQYNISVYDSMIVASALLAGCHTLYSEDMQEGMIFDQSLRIINPFRQ
jgi:predicted nucleic acid-binding protein